MILFHSDAMGAAMLKHLLESFAANTSLSLHFDKCTFVPPTFPMKLLHSLPLCFGARSPASH